MRVLIVEDNPKMSALIKQGLVEHGFCADEAHLGYEGEEMAATGTYDIIILDVMLPDRDGKDVCKNLRRRNINTPILMLTALAETNQTVEGLGAGADDYLGKPFEFEELVARIRALLRRGEATESTNLKYNGLEVDLRRRTASRDGKEINLSGKEFMLLEYFLRNPNRVLSRTQIAERVWDMNYEPTSNVIDVYVSSLRKKVDKPFNQDLIHTVVGTGYRFGVMETK